jgi:hypothetical protein
VPDDVLEGRGGAGGTERLAADNCKDSICKCILPPPHSGRAGWAPKSMADFVVNTGGILRIIASSPPAPFLGAG